MHLPYSKSDYFDFNDRTSKRITKVILKMKACINQNYAYRPYVFCFLLLFPQSLRPALLNVREMCHRISEMGLCQIDKDHTYTLTEFREAQFNQLNDVCVGAVCVCGWGGGQTV